MMSIKNLIFVFSLSFLLPSLSYANAVITAINEVTSGYEAKITGSGFGNNKSSVNFKIGKQNINAELVKWKDNEIIIIVPIFPSVTDEIPVNIEVAPKTGSVGKIVAQYKVLSKYVLGIIRQKKSGLSDEFILDDFDIQIFKAKSAFDGLNAFDEIKLKNAGFNDNVIAKFGMHPQRVTIGVSAIWLKKTKDIVTSPMIRIFLDPKSFFKKRSPFWDDDACWGKLCFPSGIFDSSKYDINIGYTTKTSTTDNGSEKKSYLLVGISLELNRSALLNFGVALVPGDIQGEQRQAYFGFTVDSNVLQELKILSKG